MNCECFKSDVRKNVKQLKYLLLYVTFKLKSKTIHLQSCVYTNLFIRLDLNNSLLKFIHVFQTHPVYTYDYNMYNNDCILKRHNTQIHVLHCHLFALEQKNR